jgi:hypothetical protein
MCRRNIKDGFFCNNHNMQITFNAGKDQDDDKENV